MYTYGQFDGEHNVFDMSLLMTSSHSVVVIRNSQEAADGGEVHGGEAVGAADAGSRHRPMPAPLNLNINK